ncbi:hypothetical protein ACJMK2_028429 [Sinanodonta woodiana]|uniref:Superoxide dismutase [Cu-Zn] n=1 Tax=Sinanodonta woodiana TaxID=1069815 RepID=A0ABD3X748_SINWO
MAYTKIKFILGTIALSFLTADGAISTSCPNGYAYAECHLRPNPNAKDLASTINGTVYFRQRVTTDCRRLGMLRIRTEIQGISTKDGAFSHGLHVHESNDLSNGCESMGPHLNPFKTNHGSLTDTVGLRHLGDFGNVLQSRRKSGTVVDTRYDYLANLVGPNSIVGRGVVFHAKKDDLGLGGDAESLRTGNAGARLACCVIEQTTKEKDFDKFVENIPMQAHITH